VGRAQPCPPAHADGPWGVGAARPPTGGSGRRRGGPRSRLVYRAAGRPGCRARAGVCARASAVRRRLARVLAAGLAASPWPVRAVLDAGRGRFATALYRREGSDWVQVDPIVGVDLDGLLRLVNGADGDTLVGRPERCAVVGDLTDQAREALDGLPRVWVAPPAASVRRPAVLAELAWQAWRRGRRPGAEDGEPIYLARA
jgi:hypothetical protein